MENIKGIDLDGLKKTLNDGVKTVQENAKNFDVNDTMHKLSDAASAGAGIATNLVNEFKEGYNKSDEKASGFSPTTTTFAKLMAYLASADGNVTQEEYKKFVEIGHEMDGRFNEYGDDLMTECLGQVEANKKEFGHLNAVKIGAQKTLENLNLSDQEKKTLCWDMLTIAGADGFDDSEIDLIRFVSQKLGLDPVVLQEMKNYYGAVADLECEKALITQSKRPYNEIEPIANRISVRQLAVTDAIHDLIEDN